MSLPLLSAAPSLRSMLMTEPMTVVDVGCAEGIDPLFRGFSEFGIARNIGFEASPTEFRKLNAEDRTKYFNLALSDYDGVIKFNEYGTLGSVHTRHDREVLYGEKYETIEVKCSSIDSLLNKGVIPTIEILKIDVEGYEATVFKGARQCLADRILCVKAEISFHAAAGTNRFSELHDQMQAYGFRLFGISYNQSPGGGPHSGDALWLKAPEVIVAASNPVEEKRRKLLHLAVISLGLRQLDYIAVIATIGSGVLMPKEQSDMHKLSKKLCFLPNVMPWTFPVLAHAFFLLSQIAFGRIWSTKATPKVNRLLPLRPLFANPLFGWMRRRHDQRQSKRVAAYLNSLLEQPSRSTEA